MIDCSYSPPPSLTCCPSSACFPSSGSCRRVSCFLNFQQPHLVDISYHCTCPANANCGYCSPSTPRTIISGSVFRTGIFPSRRVLFGFEGCQYFLALLEVYQVPLLSFPGYRQTGSPLLLERPSLFSAWNQIWRA